MKPSEMTTVELVDRICEVAAQGYFVPTLFAELRSRAARLKGWLETMDAGEPLTDAGKDRRYVLERLNAPSALRGGTEAKPEGMEPKSPSPSTPTCETCGGSGEVSRKVKLRIHGETIEDIARNQCPTCNGTGRSTGGER